jgi:hypothetical protein
VTAKGDKAPRRVVNRPHGSTDALLQWPVLLALCSAGVVVLCLLGLGLRQWRRRRRKLAYEVRLPGELGAGV